MDDASILIEDVDLIVARDRDVAVVQAAAHVRDVAIALAGVVPVLGAGRVGRERQLRERAAGGA